MRKLACALIGAAAVAASLAVPVAALAPPTPEPQFFGAERQRRDTPACQELAELRRELSRLQHEIRQLRAAFVHALRAGNRERAEQIAHEIRRVQAEIDRVEHQIRRLQQECRGR